MGFLGWIVLGLVVGVIAKLLLPGKDPGGFIVTILIGIVGAVLGGFLGKTFFHTGLGGFFDLKTWGLGLLGALILLILYRVIAGRRAHA